MNNKKEMVDLIAEWLSNEFPIYKKQGMAHRAERLFKAIALSESKIERPTEEDERENTKKVLKQLLAKL